MHWDVRKPAARGTDESDGASTDAERLVGREAELRQLEALATQHRLVTVTGVRGIGKSTVVRALLGVLQADPLRPFEHAVRIAAGGVTDVGDLAAEVARALGADDVVRAIGARKVLVAIDDVEALLEADRGGVRALFDRWLGGTEGLHLVVLSRELVGSLFEASEHELRMGALSVAASRELFLSVAGENARATEGGSEALTTLLEWLGGHPLAVRLVATEARSWPVEALLHRLEAMEDAEPPASGKPEEPLRTVFEPTLAKRLSVALSFAMERLEEWDATASELFAWLSLFPRGLPVALAPGLFGEAAWDAAALLAGRHLAIDGDEADRITLRPSLTHFARTQQQKLSPSRRSSLARRTAAALAGQLAATAARTRPEETLRARTWIARDEAALAELVGLFEELPWGTEQEAQSDATSLARALRCYVELALSAGRARGGEGLVRRAHALVVAHGGERAIVDAAWAAARVHERIDRLAEAEAEYRRADAVLASLAQPADEEQRLAIAEALATIAARSERWSEAEAILLELCVRHEARHDLGGQARAHRALGDLARRRGRPEAAERGYRRAVPLFRGILDGQAEAEALLALGETLRGYRASAAELALRDAADAAKAAGERSLQANALATLGEVLAQQEGKQGDAAAVLAECLGIVRELGDALGEATALSALADALLSADEPVEAFLRARDALAIRRRLGDSAGIATSYGLLSRAALAYGAAGRAVVLAGQAHRIRAAMSDRAGEILALQEVARALGALGRADAESAAMLVAWNAAIAIAHPFAAHMARATGLPTPPEGLLLEAQVTLTAALSDCEAELYEGGHDAEAPLRSDEEN